MIYRTLGATGISVSLLSLGTLTIGPCQLSMDPAAGGALIREALARGITLFDTAEIYGTYPHLRKGLAGAREGAAVMTKSFAPTYEAMEASLARALGEMGLERIDIFLLHQQESEHTLRGHGGALEALAKAKRDGRIRAAGLSTHHVAAVRAATACPDVDVVFALLNVRGLGIQDGTAREMEEALREAHDGGKGVILMKALAGGHLYREAREAMEYVRGRPWVHSVCVGMRSAGEIDANIALMTGSEVGDDTLGALCAGARRVVIDDCRGCGRCVEACGASALSLVDGRASCDHERCVLCGYCARACPEFSIEVV